MFKHTLRQHLSANFSDAELKRWFDPLALDLSEEQRHLAVGFPHALFGTWFTQHVQDKFEEQVARFLGPGFVVGYGHGLRNGGNGGSGGVGPGGASEGEESRPGTNGEAGPILPGMRTATDMPFGHQSTFENFLVNKKNYFPLATAREVAKQADIAFNPFVICGEAGSGKTHLVKAIGNELAKRVDQTAIFHGTIEDVNTVFAVRFKNDAFGARNYFYKFSYMLVDDFQLVRKYPKLQQELISLFNYFYDNKKQMVFACADKITSYDFLDPKLKSRMEWGLIVNLKQPDLDIRVSYIQRQCNQKKLSLTKEQILTLAQRFTDFRFLQGILLKLFAFKELVNKDIGQRDFQHILAHTEDRPKPVLRPESIIAIVSEHFGVDVKEIKSVKRHHKIVQARQVAMYLCRQLLGSSYPQLGRLFGGKDHSTVLYAVKKVEQFQNDDREMKRLLMELKQKCLTLEETA